MLFEELNSLSPEEIIYISDCIFNLVKIKVTHRISNDKNGK